MQRIISAICRRKWVVVSVLAIGLSLAAIVSYAAAHNFTDRQVAVFLLLSGDVSLLAGILVALILDRFDGGFYTGDQLTRSFGHPCIGFIPFVDDKPAPDDMQPLLKALDVQKKQVMTVASSVVGEGKTSIGLWLARLAAEKKKVILVDANLQTPHLHEILQDDNARTLVDYLTDRCELETIICKDDPSGAHMIYGCSVPNTALDLISSDAMAKFIKALRKAYDLVILDSPACLLASDAYALVGVSDRVLYVVEAHDVSREDVAAALEQFYDSAGDKLSFVLNKVSG